MKQAISRYLKIGLNPGKIPELDGLRALAIIMVLFHHFATFYREYHGSYFNALISDGIRHLLFNAWLGVDLFFVLSGYLIFHHLINIQNQPNKINTYGRYALKRVLRTFPLYYVIILMIGFGLIPYYPSDIDWSKYLVHLLFLQDYLGAHILVPLWSLATEEKFYLLAPFLLLLVNRLSPIKSIVLLLFFVILMVLLKSKLMNEADHAINYITFFEQYRAPFHFAVGSILMGVIVAILAQFEAPKNLPIWAIIAAVLIVVVLFLANLYNPNNWNWMNVLHTVVVFLFAVLVWVAVKHTGAWYMRFLTGRVFRIIAVLSYALYLAHYTILPWVFRLHKQYIQSEQAWLHAGSFLLLYLFVAVIFSLLLHYLVEKPFLTIKNRL